MGGIGFACVFVCVCARARLLLYHLCIGLHISVCLQSEILRVCASPAETVGVCVGVCESERKRERQREAGG